MFRYESIAHTLRSQIEGSVFPDNRLPSERALMELFDVQRNTVRRALAALQSDGLIVIERKRGAFIAAPPPSMPAGLTATRGLRSNIILSIERIDESTARYDIERGLHQSLMGTGRSVLYFDAGQEPASSSGLPSMEYLDRNHAAGIVVWAKRPTDTKALQSLRERLPVVLVDRRVLGFEADFVGFDDEGGGRRATEHLLAQGHRRIGFLTGEVGAETVEERWRGYQEALESAGITPDPSWVLQIAHLRRLPDVLAHSYMEAFIGQAGGEPLTAVFCTSDSTAANLMTFLRASRRRVPEEVAVVGYGDLLPDYLCALGLTTVSQMFVDIGIRAGELLRERLSNSSEAAPPYQEVRLPACLVVRHSCGANWNPDATQVQSPATALE